MGQRQQVHAADTQPVAHAVVRSKGTHFQTVFRRLLPRLGYLSAIWAVAHRLCRLVWKILHEGVHFIEQGTNYEPKLLIHRAKYLAQQLRKFGYDLRVMPASSDTRVDLHHRPGMIFDGVDTRSPGIPDFFAIEFAIMRSSRSFSLGFVVNERAHVLDR